ncbi:MAG: response regulator [Hymenobacter sp.]
MAFLFPVWQSLRQRWWGAGAPLLLGLLGPASRAGTGRGRRNGRRSPGNRRYYARRPPPGPHQSPAAGLLRAAGGRRLGVRPEVGLPGYCPGPHLLPVAAGGRAAQRPAAAGAGKYSQPRAVGAERDPPRRRTCIAYTDNGRPPYPRPAGRPQPAHELGGLGTQIITLLARQLHGTPSLPRPALPLRAEFALCRPWTPPPSPKLHMIVVEDETLIAQELSDTLLDLGYHVLATCYSYVEARQAFAEYQPDLVLLDINLRSANPTHNGLTLAQQLHERPVPRPSFSFTAYNDRDTIRQAARLRPSGYLIKPVNDATLFAAIQTGHRAQYHPAAGPAARPRPPLPRPHRLFFCESRAANREGVLGRCCQPRSGQKLRDPAGPRPPARARHPRLARLRARPTLSPPTCGDSFCASTAAPCSTGSTSTATTSSTYPAATRNLRTATWPTASWPNCQACKRAGTGRRGI